MSRRTNQLTPPHKKKKNPQKAQQQQRQIKKTPNLRKLGKKAITIVMLFTSRQVNREGHI